MTEMSAPAGVDVSVIIPTFNRSGPLLRAVRSALAQMGCSVEVIVVDDASRDDTEAVMRANPDTRLRYIRLTQNAGGANARNLGVENAVGTYIAYLDSDDHWASNKLMHQLALARGQPDENFIVYNSVVVDGDPSRRFPRRAFDPGQDDISTFLIAQRNYLQTSGLMMPRAIAHRYPFNSALRRHQDLDLIISAQRAGVRLIHCDRETVFYDDSGTVNRVGAITNPEPSIDWLELRWDWLSGPARAEMSAVLIARSLWPKQRRRALHYLGRGVISDPIILPRVGWWIARGLFRKAG